MNTKRVFAYGLIAVILALSFAACEQPTDDPPAPTLTGIFAAYNGTPVSQNTPLDNLKANLTVMAQYSDSTGKTLAPADYALSGTLAVGTNTITVTYEGKTATFTVTVYAVPSKTLTSITLNIASVKTSYKQNEPLDLSGILVTAAYSDSTSAAVTGYTSSPANGATLSTAGTIIVTFSYTEGTVTRNADFTITVTAVTPTKTLTGITLNTTSVKKAYNQNEQLDLSDLIVTAAYSNSTSAAVTGYTSSPANGATLSTTGTITITVSYTEGAVTKTADFIISVIAVTHTKTLTGIALNTTSVKKAYNQNEQLDLSDLIVTAAYSDSTSAAVTGYTSSPANGAALSTIGTITVTVNYTEEAATRTATFTVTVTKTLTGITLNSASVKKAYIQNEQLNLSGLVVTAAYSDSSSAAVTGYTSSPANGATLSTNGTRTITITYTEGAVTRTATFTVTVKSLSSITLNTTSVKRNYIQNEQLNLSGLVVTANYSNSTSAAVTNYTSNPANNATLTTTGTITVTVSYTEGSLTRTATFTVSVTPNIIVTNTNQWNTALNTIKDGGDYRSYIITVNGNFSVAGSSSPSFGSVTNLSVILQGNGRLSLSSSGNILNLGANQTLIIDSASLILQGRSDNSTSLVYIGQSATLELRNGTISGNTNSGGYGGGVYVSSYGGTFTMSGGTISGNTASKSNSSSEIGGDACGGGVYVYGTFTMDGGTISSNTSSNTVVGGNVDARGGGVYVYGTFTMNSGTISGNTASSNGSAAYGGGVLVGTIHYTSTTSFTMNGGEISGNTASSSSPSYGGGVCVLNRIYRIVTGTVYGSNEGDLSNTVTASNGSTSGAALYKETYQTTATAQRGTFNGATWNSKGDLSTTDDTIRVVNGNLQ